MNARPVPFDALDGKVAVLGVTGSGKTYTAVGLVEQLLSNGRQVIIIDPTGAYHGLRTVFPLPIFGGQNGDVDLGEDHGAAIARLIVDRDLSCIVDVSLLLKKSHSAARRFMAGFVAALKNAPPRARYVVMDEADEFMPENVGGGDTQLFGDLKWIVRRGRIDGWRMLMVTQRPQDIAKSVLTQCETLILHRLTAPQDRKAVQEWVKGNADSDQANEVLKTLAKLQVGEAWVWSPRHDLLLRATMPANRSADTSKTPDADDEPIALSRLAPLDLDGLRAALAKDAEAGPQSSAATGQPKADDRDDMIALLRQQLSDLQDSFAEAEQRGRVQGIAMGIARAREAVNALRIDGLTVPQPAEKDEAASVTESTSSPPIAPVRSATPDRAPSPAAQAIVDLLDRINPARVTWAQAATMTGRKASGGNFNAARKWIRESGLILEEGEFIRSAKADPDGMSRSTALDLWKSVLTNPAPRMIEALAECQAPVTKGRLGEMIGAKPHGGNFNGGMAQLRRNGLIETVSNGFRLARPLPGESA